MIFTLGILCSISIFCFKKRVLNFMSNKTTYPRPTIRNESMLLSSSSHSSFSRGGITHHTIDDMYDVQSFIDSHAVSPGDVIHFKPGTYTLLSEQQQQQSSTTLRRALQPQHQQLVLRTHPNLSSAMSGGNVLTVRKRGLTFCPFSGSTNTSTTTSSLLSPSKSVVTFTFSIVVDVPVIGNNSNSVPTFVLEGIEIRVERTGCGVIVPNIDTVSGSVVIRKCNISAPHGGVLLHSTSSYSLSSSSCCYSLIQDCVVHSSRHGFGVSLVQPSPVIVENCHFYGNHDAGLSVTTNNNNNTSKSSTSNGNSNISASISMPWISHCKFTQGRGCGVIFDNGAQGHLCECELFENECPGVICGQDSQPVLWKNVIRNGMSTGVTIERKSRALLEENTLFGNASADVQITTFAEPLIVRNIFASSSSLCLSITNGGRPTIAKNIFHARRQSALITTTKTTTDDDHDHDDADIDVGTSNGASDLFLVVSVTGAASRPHIESNVFYLCRCHRSSPSSSPSPIRTAQNAQGKATKNSFVFIEPSADASLARFHPITTIGSSSTTFISDDFSNLVFRSEKEFMDHVESHRSGDVLKEVSSASSSPSGSDLNSEDNKEIDDDGCDDENSNSLDNITITVTDEASTYTTPRPPPPPPATDGLGNLFSPSSAKTEEIDLGLKPSASTSSLSSFRRHASLPHYMTPIQRKVSFSSPETTTATATESKAATSHQQRVGRSKSFSTAPRRPSSSPSPSSAVFAKPEGPPPFAKTSRRPVSDLTIHELRQELELFRSQQTMEEMRQELTEFRRQQKTRRQLMS